MSTGLKPWCWAPYEYAAALSHDGTPHVSMQPVVSGRCCRPQPRHVPTQPIIPPPAPRSFNSFSSNAPGAIRAPKKPSCSPACPYLMPPLALVKRHSALESRPHALGPVITIIPLCHDTLDAQVMKRGRSARPTHVQRPQQTARGFAVARTLCLHHPGINHIRPHILHTLVKPWHHPSFLTCPTVSLSGLPLRPTMVHSSPF